MVVVSAPIVGLSSEERIKEIVEAINIELSEEDIKHLEEPYVPRPIVGHT
jgi:aryl-alcohol dehydrogenase-like predicted oxidoreductase